MNFIDLVQTIDINVFSLIVLLILLFTVRNKSEQGMIQHRLFMLLIAVNMLLTIVEIMGWIFDAAVGGVSPLDHWVNLAANVSLYCLVPIPAVLWFLYSHYQIFHDLSRLRRIAWIPILPAGLNVIVSLVSMQTGWFFSVSADNYYTRGPFFICHVLFAYGILAAAFIMAMLNRQLLEKRHFWTLLLFAVPQIAGGVLQVAIYGLSLNWAAMMISIMIVYLNLQDRGLNTDYLTGTYNRRHFEQIISNRIRRVGEDPSFAVVLCDLDRFKAINDQFGHQVGDEALQYTVQLLRGSLRKNDLIARFGGDEFYLLLELSGEPALQATIARIYQVFEQYNQTSGLPYRLELSMGGTLYNPRSGQTSEQFLHQVDHLMYQEKDRRRMIPQESLQTAKSAY